MKLEYLHDQERIKIYPENSTELRGIKNYLNRHPDNYMFDPTFKMKLWDGKRTQYKKEDDTIPMGLWKEAFKCCEEFGYPFNFINKEEFPINREVKKKEFEQFITDFFTGYKFMPRDYQIEAAWQIIKNRYCNISVATSGGKTLIYSMVLFFLLHKYKNKKFLLVVPSKTLVSQFFDDALEFNWRNQIDLNPQEIYGEEEKPRTFDNTKEPNFVISTYQSLTYEEKVDDPKARNKTKTKTISKFPKEWFKQFWSVSVDECLHPETLITMHDNSKKAIKNVKAGDLVKTINEKTLEIEIKPVVKQHHNLNKGQQMYQIELEDGSVVNITGNHKIKLTNGIWVKAEDLKGDEDILYIK